MSLNDSNAVQRFTYDWLIRFAELHRIDTDFITYDLRSSRYGPIDSPFSKISPLFTGLVKRYMPIILNPYDAEFRKDKLHLQEYGNSRAQLALPIADRKPILIPKVIKFRNTKAGTLTKYINMRVFCIDSKITYGQKSRFTPSELKYLINQTSEDLLLIDSSLTEQVNFSTIWPLLKRVPGIHPGVKNLVIDEGIAQALRHRPWEVRSNILRLYDCNISEHDILEVIDCLLEFPIFPAMFEWRPKAEFNNVDLLPIVNKIKERMTTAGYVWDITNGENMGFQVHHYYNEKTIIVRVTHTAFHVLLLPRI